jgi:hypothetical protein
MTGKCMSRHQVALLLMLVTDGRRFDATTVHPYSGVLTAERDHDTVLIDPDGRVAYDSAAPRGHTDADGREIRPGLAVAIDNDPGASPITGRIVHHLEGTLWRVRRDSGEFDAVVGHELGQPMGGEA